MQHEYDHLNGTLYVDRLDERQSKRRGRRSSAAVGGRPGHSWHPGVDPDPFGHGEDDDADKAEVR